MQFTKESKIITLIFLLTLALWLILNLSTKHTPATEGFLFNTVLKAFHFSGDIMFTLGGIMGIIKANKWGGFNSSIGRALLFISLGLITWGIGGFTWFWYLFYANIELPYPSLADVGFVLSLPLWAIGVINLSRASGTKFGLRTIDGKMLLITIPVIAVSLSYYLLVTVARGGVLDFSVNKAQLLFDLGYPLGDVFIFTVVGLSYLLSRNFLGGKYRKTILLLFVGFILMYISDFSFGYTITLEKYFNGNFVDLLFVISIFIVSVAINNLDPDIK